jgi:hypothetical protein
MKHLLIISALLCTVAQGAWATDYSVKNETELKGAIENGANITLTQDITVASHVTISANATVTIDLGGYTLRGNSTALDGSDGNFSCIFIVAPTGNLTLSNGTLADADNSATSNAEHSAGAIVNKGTATLTNVNISNCKGYNGGAIRNNSGATLTITGGTISGNRAVSNGGGIYNNGTISMSGNPNITGNENGNLYLDGTTVINCGTFTEGASIGVSLANGKYNRAFTSGYNSNNSGIAPGTYFSADLNDATLSLKDNEAYIAANGYIYIERSWTGQPNTGHVVSTTKLATNCSYYSDTEDLNGGWYILNGSQSYSKRPACHGDVKFILQDGCNVEFKKGIHIDKGKKLTIYAQPSGTGKLRATGDGGSTSNGDAAIGGNNEVPGGSLEIHGGNIEAKPYHNCAAGIGGGDGDSGMENIIIYGGTVTATGSSSGAGIGTGEEHNHKDKFGYDDDDVTYPNIKIYGGTVTATGGDYAAGIGGGEDGSNPTVQIYGGTVTAKGGKNAAGIGSGENADTEYQIYIYGGTVNATGGDLGAGIGGGKDGEVKRSINFNGGTVTAKGGNEAAGIGGGGDDGGQLYADIWLSGGTITATGGENAPGVGSGKASGIHGGYGIHVDGSTVYATGGKYAPGVGCGKEGTCDGTVLEMLKGYLEATSRGADAACIGGAYGSPGGAVRIYDGTTVKCIYTNEYSCSKKNSVFIGRGGASEDKSNGAFNIGVNMSVSKDGNLVGKNSRQSTCQSHPSGYSTVIVQPCSHSGANYTIKDQYYHTFSCSYCTGSIEYHNTDGENSSCTLCGYNSGSYTITLYEALADGKGYSATPIVETTGLGVTYTLPECSSVPDRKDFVGWKKVTGDAPTDIEAEEEEMGSLKAAGSSFKVSENVVYYARYKTCWTGEGTGTSEDPFQIASTDNWNYLAEKVNSGHVTYKGKYFKMTNDISVTTQVGEYGSTSKCFAGILYGDGHTLDYTVSGSSQGLAPFGSANAVTISDLHVTGTITTSAKFASGLIAYLKGNTNITNCRVSVTINSSVEGDGTHGGFIGNFNCNDAEQYVTLSRCVFDGRLLGSSTTNCGGFVGYADVVYKNQLKLRNCLFKPTEVTLGSGCRTFCRPKITGYVSYSKCYYTQSLGTSDQGTKAYTVSCGTPGMWLYYGELNFSNTSEAISDLQHFENEVFPFDAGLLFQAVFYTGGTSEVTFTPLTNEYGKGAAGVTASEGTLTANGDGTYTLAMNNESSSVTATIETYDDLKLYDEPASDSNTSVLEANDGQTKNVTISGRTLYKDGNWNTLCLPFDVSEDFINNSDHPLHDATIMELDVEQTGFDAEQETLYLYFKEATKIDARRPYIVKWDNDGTTITSPVFYNSTIESSSPKPVTSTDGKVSFTGIYDPKTLKAKDNTVLYLGAGNKLYYPSKDKGINSFRAYFQLSGITAGEPETPTQGGPSNVRAFVLNFGDEDGNTTGIIDAEANSSLFTLHSSLSGWYDLQGRKLSAKPTKKGVYIYNGKKRVIK